MARIAGIDLKDNWRVDYALTHIKGIGWSHAQKILTSAQINPETRVSKLTTEDLTQINGELENYLVEGDLLRKVRENIQRIKAIHTYRGIRHNRGLPVRGQRTKSNARTKRGKRRTVGAFRKEELAKQTTTTT